MPEPSNDKHPFQFSLRQLMLAPVGVALFFMTAERLGMPSAILLAGVAGVVGVWFWPFLTIVERLLCIAIIGILAALLWPAVQTSHGQGHRRGECSNTLKLIGLALHRYHDVYKCFPPAYVADENGVPVHSWRVLILPYFEDRHQAIYDQYDFSEPWDGPNNSLLHDTVVRAYKCPSEENRDSPMTNYVVITGQGTAFVEDQSSEFADFADGTSNTLLVTETTGSDIHWMEPRDLNVEEMPAVINPGNGRSQGISSMHPGGVCVAIADGSVHFLPDSLPTKTLRGMLTIAGGEVVDWDN